MPVEQAGSVQPEERPYDDVLHDDVAAAFKATTEAAPVEAAADPAPVETKPAETVVADEPVADSDGRLRGPDGKFVAKEKEPETEVVAEKPVPSGVSKTTEPASATGKQPAQVLSPPDGLSVKTKAQWDRLPQSAREDFLALATGAPDQSLKPFMERAKQGGQTLSQALQAYTGIEDLIRRDVGAGLTQIVSNTGLTQHQAGQLFLSLAQRFGVVPTGHQSAPSATDASTQADPTADLRQMLAPVLQPFMKRIDELEGGFRQQTEAEQRQRLTSATAIIEKFRSDPAHKYYANVEATVGDLLEKGVVQRTGDLRADLATAYDHACRLHPEISEALIEERIAAAAEKRLAAEKEAAEKARSAARSVTGSPSPGSTVQVRQDQHQDYDTDLHNDVAQALRSVGARA